jgi:hypothetical protein
MSEGKLFREIVLDKWIPAVATGLIVATLVPLVNSQFSQSSALRDTKEQLFRSVANEMSTLMFNLQSVVVVASTDAAGLTDGQKKILYERFNGYVTEIARSRLTLSGQLAIARRYFDDDVDAQITAFIAFDGLNAAQDVGVGFDKEGYLKWRTEILEAFSENLAD